MPEFRPIRLRYQAVCSSCGIDLPPGTQAVWDRVGHAATCLDCLQASGEPRQAILAAEPVPFGRGEAGASTRRRFQRLHDRREEIARERFGRFSAIYLALSNEPQSTMAWAKGSSGERKLGAYLDALSDNQSLIVLHDRRMPGTSANIDHVALTPSGIFVIDAKNYAGKVQKIDKGGWFSTDFRLYVGRRDCSKLIPAMAKQVQAVQAAVGESAIQDFSLQVTPVLCFVAAEWSFFARPFQLGGVWVEWPGSLRERLQAPGLLSAQHIEALSRKVAAALPAA